MTHGAHRVSVRVLREEGYWIALPDGVAGGASADSLPQLFAEIEFTRHFYADAPEDEAVFVEYVAGQPWISDELNAAHAAFLALPPHLRPQAVAWDHDNDRPKNPAHTGPYLNLEQMSAFL